MKTTVTSNITKVAQHYQRMSRKLPGVVDNAINDLVQSDAIPQFAKTVATWQHQPRFMAQKMPRGWGVRVDPEFPYGWVNAGTRPHVIEAKRAPLLRFRVPFKAKTKPNVIASYTGSRGSEWRSKKRVNHPGNEPRNFSDIILKRVQVRAANAIRAALKEASYGEGMGL